MKNELEIALTTYIALKHTQEECVGFIDGFKAAEERMYSEEEKELMIKIFHSYWFENNHEHEDNLKEWELSKKLFEQFKNKKL